MSSSSTRGGVAWCGLLVVVLGWCCTGCAPADPLRQAVSGAVTLDGKPASGITVVFTPTGSDMLGAVVEVIDGRFSLAADAGPSAGKHDVTVDTIEPDLEDFEQRRAASERPFSEVKIHPRFTKAGALTADVQHEVANEFLFELKSR